MTPVETQDERWAALAEQADEVIGRLDDLERWLDAHAPVLPWTLAWHLAELLAEGRSLTEAVTAATEGGGE